MSKKNCRFFYQKLYFQGKFSCSRLLFIKAKSFLNYFAKKTAFLGVFLLISAVGLFHLFFFDCNDTLQK